MGKKKIESSSPKKKFRILLLPKTTPKNPSTTTKNFATRHNFFLQVMNKILERKKNNQKKTKQAREKEIMFLFLTPRFRKKKTTKLQNPRKHKKQANKKNKNP